MQVNDFLGIPFAPFVRDPDGSVPWVVVTNLVGMRDAFVRCFESYRPGHAQRFQIEAGTTAHSIANVAAILDGDPALALESVIAGREGALLTFYDRPARSPVTSAALLSTGFAFGYSGEGPSGLAGVLERAGAGTFEEWRTEIAQFNQTTIPSGVVLAKRCDRCRDLWASPVDLTIPPTAAGVWLCFACSVQE